MRKRRGWVMGITIVMAVIILALFGKSDPVAAPVVATTDGGNTPTTTPDTTGKYKDGTYTGPVADAIYGPLQLKVTISGGAITDVTWPVYPNDPGHTTMVNNAALPSLKQEAIASQSANVNIVSGATQTSEAFQQSLSAALTQAKA